MDNSRRATGPVGARVHAGRMTHLIPLADALGPIREVYAHLLTDAERWQEGRDRRTDPDLFALICVATDTGFGSTSPTRWLRTDVRRVLRCDVPNWCSANRCLWPIELVEAMWEWFGFLADTGRPDPASDPLCELRKPLMCYGGLDERGHFRPEGTPAVVACECHLPYRETTELLNRLGLQCEYSGRDPLDVLRALVGDGPRHPGPAELEVLLREVRAEWGDDRDDGLPLDDDPPSWL